MICKNCKETIPDNSVFCPSCGQRAEAEVEQVTVYEEAPQANTCINCGTVLDPDALFCNNCGAQQVQQQAEAPVEEFVEEPALPKKKKKVGLWIALGSVGLVLAIGLIIGLVTNWFGLTGPAAQIARAAKKTWKAENFTVDFNCSVGSRYASGSTTVEGTAQISIDPNARELTVYAEAEMDGEQATLAIYDGYAIMYADGHYEYEDISDELDEFFDAYDTASSDFSWEEILGEDVFEEAEEYVDFDALNGCIRTYFKKLNNKKWLQQNAGYSVRKENGIKMHTFEPNYYDFAMASLPFFEAVFMDNDTYEEAEDGLAELKPYAKNIDTTFAIGIKGGKLARLEGSVSASMFLNAEVDFEMDIYSVGKTTFDFDELDDLLSNAMNANKKYPTYGGSTATEATENSLFG